MAETGPLDRSARVYIAGHHGLAGGAVRRAMADAGFTDLVGARSAEVDLRDRRATSDHLHDVAPDVVVLAAATVGGIAANAAQPVDFLSDNLRIQLNVMDAARELGVDRLLFLGSSCIYPKFAPQPIAESSFMTGPLEPTNAAYATAKIAGIAQVQAVRAQYGLRWVTAMPTNLYGPGDTYDLERSHVLPAMIRRFHEARVAGADEVLVWGTGTPRREFLFSEDLGRAVLVLLDRYDSPEIINVGFGDDVSIAGLAALVAGVVGFGGRIGFDRTRPDGTPRKLLDSSRLAALGWAPQIGLEEGIRRAYASFLTPTAR